jgi:hypothetical protein
VFVCFSHVSGFLSDCRELPLWDLQDDCHIVKSFPSLSHFLISKEGFESHQRWIFLFKDQFVAGLINGPGNEFLQKLWNVLIRRVNKNLDL